jgi:small-conductance mechanosensitive channel
MEMINVDLSPVGRLMEGLAGSSTPKQALTQLAIAAVALVLGWVLARVLRRVPTSPRWQFGVGGFERVAFPLISLGLIALGRLFLPRHHPTAGLEIITALLTAMVVIRLAVYVLRMVLPQGAFLRVVLRGIAWAAWIGVALHVTGLLPEVVDALDSVGLSVGKDKQKITPWLAMQAVAALGLTMTVAMWLSRITESRVLAAETVEMSTRMVVSKLVRVAAIFVAVLVALPLVGIDVTTLSVFSGALGVGLGFGLQKVASNYVSGFIVLLDHSLRIGDLVTVADRRGIVKAIESRYTVIRSLDGNEAIIPNETLITTTVVHHTYTDPKVSVTLPLSIAYDADVERALSLLLQVAGRMKRVLAEPAPGARIKQLGDSGVELELSVWVSDPEAGEGDLRSDLYRDILRTFRAEGIDIPYPRRDVRVIATPETLKSGEETRA